MRRRIALLASMSMGLVACEVTSPPLPSRIIGAQHITFRCAPRAASTEFAVGPLRSTGAPLDGCGCTTVINGALDVFDAASCVVGNAEVRAYVAGNGTGEVAAVRLNRGPLTNEGRILDVDETIPEVTGIFVDDLISDMESEPNGQFVLAVRSTSGTIAVLVDDFEVNPARLGRDDADDAPRLLDPDVGPLASIAVWPPIERILDRSDDGLSMALAGSRRAWVTAPTTGQIIELDLDAVARRAEGEDVPRDAWLTTTLTMPEGTIPQTLAVHADGDRLYVGHAATPAITVFDLITGQPTGTIDLSRRPACGDGYLTSIIGFDEDRSCTDGLDNNGDGTIDGDDPSCDGAWGSEAPDPSCPQRFECADGVDNDGDSPICEDDDPDCVPGALTDLADPDCVGNGRWERTPPQCADGEDNDEDGLVDRDDPGCRNESDPYEGSENDGFEVDDQCDDQIDNDADGLVDDEDPGCVDPNAALRYSEERAASCADGFDNDGDGLVDYAGGDTDCYAASDDDEGGATIEVGPSALLTAQFVLNGRVQNWLYSTEARGYLIAVDLDDPSLRPRFTGMRGAVQGMALRQKGLSNSMLAILNDSALRSMEITEPAPLRTADNRDVFARLPDAWLADIDPRRFSVTGARVDAFFTIEDGVAARISAMDHICPVKAVPEGEGAACPAGRSAAEGACVPSACAQDSDCAGGVCLDSTCARACDDRGECDADERCATTTLLDGTTSPSICQSRCRVDTRGLIDVLPLDDPCEGRDCDGACAVDGDCGDGTACVAGTCQAWCTAEGCRPPFDLATATPVRGNRSLSSPLAREADRWRILHDEANIISTARGRAPRVLATPTGQIRTAPVTTNLERYPAFCRIPQPVDGVGFPGWGEGLCVPETATFDAAGTLQDPEDPGVSERLQSRVDGFPGIQLIEDRRGILRSQAYELVFDGDLPRSASRNGQHQGLVDIGLDPELLRPEAVDDGRVSSSGDVEGWVLTDYDQDFCRAGVEVGDVLLIERMVPRNVLDQLPSGASSAQRAAAEAEQAEINARCAPFTDVDTALPPGQRRDPLRFRVAEVGPFKLVLRPDGLLISDRVDYDDMVRRDDRLVQPRLAAPRPSPPAECMVELTTYRVRVADQFVLSGVTTGYRHPWVREGGQCVEDPQRIGRRSRVTLGVPFENEWFRFMLGSGDPDNPLRPHMIDFSYVFSVGNGYLLRTRTAIARVPQGMRWLPNSDLLYIVDGGIQTLIEVGGLDVFAGDFFISNSSYD